MQRRDFIVASALGTVGAGAVPFEPSPMPEPTPSTPVRATRKILIAGGGFRTEFIRYMAALTGKKRPRICYLPTASADSPDAAVEFYKYCAPLDVEPHVQNVFIESLTQKEGWDEVFLSMDAIVVSGGNTLNQQAIWKAQGIDVVLRQRFDQLPALVDDDGTVLVESSAMVVHLADRYAPLSVMRATLLRRAPGRATTSSPRLTTPEAMEPA